MPAVGQEIDACRRCVLPEPFGGLGTVEHPVVSAEHDGGGRCQRTQFRVGAGRDRIGPRTEVPEGSQGQGAQVLVEGAGLRRDAGTEQVVQRLPAPPVAERCEEAGRRCGSSR
jgi:hypothetical protein